MTYYKPFLAASALALLLAGLINHRITTVKNRLDVIVYRSHITTEGYDQQFIQLVNNLERSLATRASFEYRGNKGPVAGRKRPQGLPQREGTVHGPANQFRVTAIISGAAGQKTSALVIVGERSFSVKPGDVIDGKKITEITKEGIYVDEGSQKYFYAIHAGKGAKAKDDTLQKQ